MYLAYATATTTQTNSSSPRSRSRGRIRSVPIPIPVPLSSGASGMRTGDKNMNWNLYMNWNLDRNRNSVRCSPHEDVPGRLKIWRGCLFVAIGMMGGASRDAPPMRQGLQFPRGLCKSSRELLTSGAIRRKKNSRPGGCRTGLQMANALTLLLQRVLLGLVTVTASERVAVLSSTSTCCTTRRWTTPAPATSPGPRPWEGARCWSPPRTTALRRWPYRGRGRRWTGR